ncbi:MAG: VCBS repeat-containing protein, partial [Alkalinema sp. RU_4_3]|nr:VCBS repeat-containing protein [Alkalinema sp. RU_4_3]
MLMRNQTTGAQEIRFMRGSEVIQTNGLLAVGMNYQVAGLVDLDGDRKADIVW